MSGKRIYLFCLLLLTLLFSACEIEKENFKEAIGPTSLTFGMTRTLGAILNNTEVYLFDGDGVAEDQFNRKIVGINYGIDQLTMPVAAGQWNMALVGANRPINSQLISPARGQQRGTLKMWKTLPVAGVLPTMPELRTAFFNHQTVVANQANLISGAASFARNVALVKVVVVDAGGLDLNGTHSFKLSNVPTTLNWNGELYPSKVNPTVSAAPMIGQFTIRNHPTMTAHQVSDTLQFIIPAHKGSDYLNANPTDTTTHKLKLSLDMACVGGGRFEKSDVIIPRVPRVNSILLVRLTLGGTLDVSTEVIGWVDRQLDVDLSQTQLFTDRSSVELAHKDTLRVNTNATNFTVSKDANATWITGVRKVDGNAVEITADLASYIDNNPRSSYITIKANNITKKIPVRQRPERGTIQVDQKRLVFCPVNHVTRMVNVTSVGGDWKILSPSSKASASRQSGVAGTSALTFTRSSTTNEDDFDTYYGDGQVVVKNLSTLDTDTISLINSFLYMYENTINVNAPTGTETSVVTYSQDLNVYGGSKGLIFTSWSDWIQPLAIRWNTESQTLTLKTNREPNDEERVGHLEFWHRECTDYKVRARVYQDVLVTIPAFDYFVLKFSWLGDDVDVAAEFRGNNLLEDGSNNNTYDKKPVGWGLGATSVYNGSNLLEWGGDARYGEGETVFFNAPVLEGDVYSPRRIKLDVYATWYSGNMNSAPTTPVTFTLTAYKGGTMTHVGTNFENTGGQELYNSEYLVRLATVNGAPTYATGGYTRVATITYDRVKHSASINLWASTVSRSLNATPSVNTPLKSEAKPDWSPTIVHTYSDGYKGIRK